LQNSLENASLQLLLLEKKVNTTVKNNLGNVEEQALTQLIQKGAEERSISLEIEELNQINDPVTAFRKLSSILRDTTIEKLEPDLLTQIKVAIKDVIAQKAFSIENFETLQLVILNIQEVLSHPILKDELEEFCKAAITQLIEKLAREELSTKALDFLDRNLEVLHPEITREVLPEILNPFLVSLPKEQKDTAQKLIDKLSFLLSYIIDSEQALAQDLKSKKIEARAVFNEIKGNITKRDISEKQNTGYILFILVFIFLLILFLFFLN